MWVHHLFGHTTFVCHAVWKLLLSLFITLTAVALSRSTWKLSSSYESEQRNCAVLPCKTNSCDELNASVDCLTLTQTLINSDKIGLYKNVFKYLFILILFDEVFLIWNDEKHCSDRTIEVHFFIVVHLTVVIIHRVGFILLLALRGPIHKQLGLSRLLLYGRL